MDILISSIVAGLLLGTYYLVTDHFRLTKKVKGLNTQVGTQLQEITKLENEQKSSAGNAAITAGDSADQVPRRLFHRSPGQ